MASHHISSLSLTLVVVAMVCLTSVKANNLTCWSDRCYGADWCFETCHNKPGSSQRTCLAQYREDETGNYRSSFFGCHYAACPHHECVPAEGSNQDFSCCCSGDLCNSIPELTPVGSTPTPFTNPESPPTTDPHDGVLVCEEYTCGENSDECYYGYQECPHNENSICQADYRYNSTIALYQLLKKECTTVDDLSWCGEPGQCEVDTSGQHEVKLCCCTGDLCNQNVSFTHPENVDMMIYDPCADLGCDHSCIVHNNVPQCYCNYGHALSEDGKTCVDLNECDYLNGGCEKFCVNEIGTGYHCGCLSNQKLSDDQRSCEETGLICHHLSCNSSGIGCHENFYENQYCDEASEDPATNANRNLHRCQATYKLRDDGIFEPRFLSCFPGTFECTDDSVCVLDLVNPELNIYHCCCKENYCNAHWLIDFPSVVPPNSTTRPPETSATTSHVSDTTLTPVESNLPTSPTGSSQTQDESQSKMIFIIVVILAVVLLIPVIAAAIGCICYMYCNDSLAKHSHDIETASDQERFLTHSPDLTFHNITFIDKVGQGRFAAVWRAKNVEAEVAVKVFPNTQLSRDSWTRECSIYNTPELEHKNILAFRGSVERGNELWIVSDYYSLGSLHDLLKKQTLSLKQFCELAESAAVGLAHLHDQRIVDGVTKKPSIAHRDLKSKNILIRNNFTCVISDFGLAVKFLSEETSIDAHGQVGTSRYMAPEVLDGAISFHREAYLRIDVYAFALILWELASRTHLPNSSIKQYVPPFDEYNVTPNPSIEEMREMVVTQFKRPTIPKGFATSGEYDSLRDTIEESWDQEPEARLSTQCIAERIRMFKLSKFGSKDSGLTDTSLPADLTCNSESIDSQLAPTTPSLSSSRTMSPMTSKNFMLDSGTESIGVYNGQAFSSETVRLGTSSSNSSFVPFRSRGSVHFNPPHHFCEGPCSRGYGHHHNHHHHHHHHALSNRAMNSFSTETTV